VARPEGHAWPRLAPAILTMAQPAPADPLCHDRPGGPPSNRRRSAR